MPSYTITWSERIDPPWLGMESCRIGDVPLGLGTPEQYILVASEDQAVLRVDAYASSDECFAFKDAILWHEYLVIGWGHHIYLIHLDSRSIIDHELGSYLGKLYACEDCLLVASAERLSRIAPDGTCLWQTDTVGIDGVIVHDIRNGIVHGSGEWDPPGGWRPFLIHLDSGQIARAR